MAYNELMTQYARASPITVLTYPNSKVHGTHLGPTGPRWAPCFPHELCYLGSCTRINRVPGVNLLTSKKWQMTKRPITPL